MSHTNLFSQLAGYSQNPRKRSLENFTTELLAHFFNEDPVFRRRFISTVFADRRKARPFRSALASTQVVMAKDCRVDLVLKTETKIHLIEVKIAASETLSGRWGQTGKPQVQRYLDLKCGHVTYLTTRASLPPDTDHRGRKFVMVRHALFEDLYRVLRAAKIAPLTETFLEFMEENDMSGPNTFKAKEIKAANQAMLIVQKCLDTLAIVRSEANDLFRRNFRTYSNLTRPTYSGWDSGGEVQCYLANYSRKNVRSVGLSITPEGDQLYFIVWMWGVLDPSITKIRNHLDWYAFDGEHGCAWSIPINGTPNDIPRMIKHAGVASRKLANAIRRFA